MKYSTDINPFFETFIYLSQRFTAERTSTCIDSCRPSETVMPNSNWVCFEHIADIEHELDMAFKPDELMKHYFTPLQTHEERPGDFALTLGGILLAQPQNLSEPLSYDALARFFQSVSSEVILSHFCDVALNPFFVEPCEGCRDLSKFMEMIDAVLVQPQDKWNLVDVAANPVRHLEKLRTLVDAVSDFIEQRSKDFAALIEAERDAFCSDGSIMEMFHMMGFDLPPEKVEKITIYPSLLSFNQVAATSLINGDIHIYMGIFGHKMLELRKNEDNTEIHLNLLKLLSDGTRFKALHEMCDNYSYGQELAEKLGGSRNAMYYHLEKLMGYGLIVLKVTDYRMLYTMNKQYVYEKLTALRDFLVNGWSPAREESLKQKSNSSQRENVQETSHPCDNK